VRSGGGDRFLQEEKETYAMHENGTGQEVHVGEKKRGGVTTRRHLGYRARNFRTPSEENSEERREMASVRSFRTNRLRLDERPIELEQRDWKKTGRI